MSKHARTNRAVESPTGPDEYVVEVDGGENVSDAAAEALAAVSDEASPSLHDIVDPDALDSLFAPRFGGTKREGGLVVFDHEDYRFVVDSAAGVSVRRRA